MEGRLRVRGRSIDKFMENCFKMHASYSFYSFSMFCTSFLFFVNKFRD